MTDDQEFERQIRRTLTERAESVSSEPDLTSLMRRSTQPANLGGRSVMMFALAAAAVLVVVAAAMVVRAGLDRDEQQLTVSEGRRRSNGARETEAEDPKPSPSTTVTCTEAGGPGCTDGETPNSPPPDSSKPDTTDTTIPSDPPTTTVPDNPDTTVAPPTTDSTTPFSVPDPTTDCPAGFELTAPADPVAEFWWGENRVQLAFVDSGASTSFYGGWAEAVDFEGCFARVTDSQGEPLRLAVGGSVTHLDGIECSEMDSVLTLLSGTSTDGVTWTFTLTQASLQGTTAVMEPRGEIVLSYPDDAEQIERAGTVSCPTD